jgi:nucleoside-diphosphate-sugar epimerase
MKGIGTCYIVFGSNGFVGNAIATHLEIQGKRVLRVSRDQHDFNSQVKWRLIENVEEDDILIFAAAKVPVRRFSDFRVNMDILNNFLFNFAEKKPGYLVNISSDAVYADTKEFISEYSTLGPSSLHGSMHLVREKALDEVFGGSVLHLRPTLIYGFRDPHSGYGPNKFIKDALEKGMIELFGKGEEMRDHIYIDDVGSLASMAIDKRICGCLNMVSGETNSFFEIAKEVSLNLKDTEIVFSPRIGPIPHLGLRRFSAERVKEFAPNFDFTDISNGIKQILMKVSRDSYGA